MPLKSNFWFELHLANVDSANGLPRMETVLRRLPYFDIAEFDRYASLGEAAYVDSFRAPALAALRAAPLHFAGNVLRRAADAAVFCRREGGGQFTRFPFRQGDAPVPVILVPPEPPEQEQRAACRTEELQRGADRLLVRTVRSR